MVEPERAVNGGAPGSAARGARLLEVDPDFAAGLNAAERAEANRIVLPTAMLDAGPFRADDLVDVAGVRGEARGFLLLSGAVTANLAIDGLICTRLLTPGELILLDGWAEDSIPVKSGWAALETSTLAIFDDRLLLIAGRWPQLLATILKRAAQQIRHALLQQAISQLPRIEDRLLALLWSIADRRGVVRADGIAIHLPITHAVLANMIGAKRPTVSLGLTSLQNQGHITRLHDGWRLAHESLQAFPNPQRAPNTVID